MGREKNGGRDLERERERGRRGGEKNIERGRGERERESVPDRQLYLQAVGSLGRYSLSIAIIVADNSNYL